MPQEGTWQEGDVVLIHDLSNDSGRRPPYPVLGRIENFMTEQRGQAWIRYGDPPRYVSRPMALLTRVTGAADEISPDGLLFDPLAIEDQRIQKEGQVGSARLALPAHPPVDLPANVPADLPENRPAHRPVDLPANLPAQLPAELPIVDPADTLINRGNHEVVPGDNALTPGYGSVRPHRARPQKQPYWHQQ